jgi:hypothetical protein
VQETQSCLGEILSNCVLPDLDGKKKIKNRLRELYKKPAKEDGKGQIEEDAIDVSDYDDEENSLMEEDSKN